MMCAGVMRVAGAMRVTGRSSIWESLELALCFAVVLLRRATFWTLEAVDLGAMPTTPHLESLSPPLRGRREMQSRIIISEWSFVHLKSFTQTHILKDEKEGSVACS